MKQSDSEKLKDSIYGSLEISIHEIEMLSELVTSMFMISHAMNQPVPEELKAVRDKLGILKDDLLKEHIRRISLMDAAT